MYLKGSENIYGNVEMICKNNPDGRFIKEAIYRQHDMVPNCVFIHKFPKIIRIPKQKKFNINRNNK